MNTLTVPILTPAERAHLGLDDLDDAWCSRCEAHRNSGTGEYTLHLTITARVDANTVRHVGTLIRKLQPLQMRFA